MGENRYMTQHDKIRNSMVPVYVYKKGTGEFLFKADSITQATFRLFNNKQKTGNLNKIVDGLKKPRRGKASRRSAFSPKLGCKVFLTTKPIK